MFAARKDEVDLINSLLMRETNKLVLQIATIRINHQKTTSADRLWTFCNRMGVLGILKRFPHVRSQKENSISRF